MSDNVPIRLRCNSCGWAKGRILKSGASTCPRCGSPLVRRPESGSSDAFANAVLIVGLVLMGALAAVGYMLSS